MKKNIKNFSPIIGLGFSSGGKSRNNIEEIIKNNVEKGAKEFFVGYNPPYWYNKLGFEVSPNGRFAEHEQVTSKEDLELIVKEVHKYGVKIMGNLNAWYYNEISEKEIKQIINDFLEVGIDGFICGSLGILEYLDSISEGRYNGGYILNGKKIQINISTIMAVYNKDAIHFLLETYPITKIILSREITLEEIEDILTSFPNLKFEVFGEGDFCRYNNGLCFAEHKYTDRDICTVVVNDLIVRKSINYDFRKIIKNENLTENQKVEKFYNEYKNEFQVLEELLEDLELEENKEETLVKIKKQLIKIRNKYILFFDPLKSINDKNNKNLKLVLIAYKELKENKIFLDSEEIEFIEYLKKEYKYGLKENIRKVKELKGGKYELLAKEKDGFYNRNDLLNLYAYKFFSKFKNIDTVKFPTRGRNYLSKINLISSILKGEKEIIDILNLENTYIRSHYDLKYLFNNKNWFYIIRKKILLNNQNKNV